MKTLIIIGSILQLILFWSQVSNATKCPELRSYIWNPISEISLQWPYLNVRPNSGNGTKSEFTCNFVWTDRDHMQKKLLDRMTNRHKRILRWTVPVIGYNNPYATLYNYSGHLTWVWAMDTHEYMLYYPHNFISISLMTMGIITEDWLIGYYNFTPNDLLERDSFDEYEVAGYCDPHCMLHSSNASCGIGKYELENFLHDMEPDKSTYKWSKLCLLVPYDNVTDIVNYPLFAFPDFLYYWRFLHLFFAKRPITGLGRPVSSTDLVHYYCYDSHDNCSVKVLLRKYHYIFIIATLMWLFSPLLLYYFPSSRPRASLDQTNGEIKFLTSFKLPVYFGNYLRYMMCYYVPENDNASCYLIRFRRAFFILVIIVASIRLFMVLPTFYNCTLLFCALLLLLPKYFSVHLKPQYPRTFMNWSLPHGLIREKEDLTEYQLLAHVMQERLYLIVDMRFWKFVTEKSFKWFSSFLPMSAKQIYLGNGALCGMFTLLSILTGICVFVVAFVLNILWFFVPMMYFCKEIIWSVCKAQYAWAIDTPTLISLKHLVKLTVAFFYIVLMIACFLFTIIVVFTCCHGLAEISMFTFIGGVISPTMAFQYFTLIASLISGIYSLVYNFHEDYKQILDVIINILQADDVRESLSSHLTSLRKELEKDKKSSFMEIKLKLVQRDPQMGCQRITLLHSNFLTTSVSKKLFDDVAEMCRPIRRQLFLILLKIIAMVFYAFVALWVKNVHHLEGSVSIIFKLIADVAIAFVPNLLQFLTYKSHFGKITDQVLKLKTFNALKHILSDM